LSSNTKEGYLIDHIVNWISKNIDPRTGKAELHADQQQLKNIDKSLLEKYSLPLDYPEDTVKFQLHRVIFKSEKETGDFLPLFDKFEDLVDPEVVECIPVLKIEKGKLNQGDEFRWRVIPLTPLLVNILSNLVASPITSLPQGAKVAVIRTMIQEISKRRFDVRIISMTNMSPLFGSDDFTFTAQTLADHPYAGRRSWRLKKLDQAYAAAGGDAIINDVLNTIEGREITLVGYYRENNPRNPQDKQKHYLLETVEINTFPWLIDYTGEITTSFGMQNGAESARLNWERFLKRCLSQAGGSIIEDSALLQGYTIHNKADIIKSDSLAQYTLSEYPDIANEFSLISSLPGSQTKDIIFMWKQIDGPKVDLKDGKETTIPPMQETPFIAPNVEADNTKLTFELTIKDKIRATTDRIDIIVDKANHNYQGTLHWSYIYEKTWTEEPKMSTKRQKNASGDFTFNLESGKGQGKATYTSIETFSKEKPKKTPPFTDVLEAKSEWSGVVDLVMTASGSYKPGEKIYMEIGSKDALVPVHGTHTVIAGNMNPPPGHSPGDIYSEAANDEISTSFFLAPSPIISSQGGSASGGKIDDGPGTYSITINPIK
jgi:hypothetical protein